MISKFGLSLLFCVGIAAFAQSSANRTPLPVGHGTQSIEHAAMWKAVWMADGSGAKQNTDLLGVTDMLQVNLAAYPATSTTVAVPSRYNGHPIVGFFVTPMSSAAAKMAKPAVKCTQSTAERQSTITIIRPPYTADEVEKFKLTKSLPYYRVQIAYQVR